MRDLDVRGDNDTQIITIEQDGEQIAVYPSMVPGLVAQLMGAAVMLGTGMNYPAVKQPITFNKGN